MVVVFLRKNLYLFRLNATGMFMKTATKIAIARAMHHIVRFGRSVAGRPDKGIFSRRGVVYELDLSQGIDFAIYLGGMFERSTAVALARLTEPSSLVLDIGANIGAHTLHLANLVGPEGRVMAFEPTDFAFRKLRRNLDLNPSLASRVEAFHCFLTASDGASVPDAIYSSWPLTGEAGCTPSILAAKCRRNRRKHEASTAS